MDIIVTTTLRDLTTEEWGAPKCELGNFDLFITWLEVRIIEFAHLPQPNTSIEFDADSITINLLRRDGKFYQRFKIEADRVNLPEMRERLHRMLSRHNLPINVFQA